MVNETGKYRSLRKQTLNPVCRALNRSVSAVVIQEGVEECNEGSGAVIHCTI